MKTKQFKYSLLLILLLHVSCSTNDDTTLEAKNTNIPEEKSTTITSKKEGFTINLIDEQIAINQSIKDNLINIFHSVYSKMARDFNPNAPKVVDVVIDTTYDGVAYAEIDKNRIIISSEYINDKPSDVDLLTHELMHIIQSYPYGGPGWLTEGIADYARYVYGVNNTAANWSLPSHSEGQNYSDGYGVSASFLKWIKATYDNEIINKLDSNLRKETYTYISWVENTGFTLPDLWLLYSQKPVGDKDWTIASTLKVSKENMDGVNALEGSLKVVDGNLVSKFLVFDFPTDFWMQQELPEEEIVNKYTLTSGDDVPERDPKNWTISGSNNEQDWTNLDAQSNQSFRDRNQTKEYTFNSTTPYKYYRITITTNNGATIFQLSEWRLFQKQ